MRDHGRHAHHRPATRHRAPLFVVVVVAAFVAGQLWWQRSSAADRDDLRLSVDPQRGVPELAAGDDPTAPTPGVDEGRSLFDALHASTTTAAVASTTTPAAAPTTPAVLLPVPEALPDDPYADTPETIVGRIAIPTIGLDEALQQGMTLTAINRGPSHWPGTAGPGELGNVVVAGHRTTYSRPFHDLDLLQVGDPVVYTTDRGTFTYAVTGTEIVTPEEVRIADQTAAYTSTLFACHPPGSAAYRIVVHLQLLDAAGRPVPRFDPPVAPVTIPRPA